MDLHLRVLVGDKAGTTVRVAGPKFYVGRAADCQLRPRDEAISRYHCVLVIEENHAIICDLGSRNGTYVNGERIASETRLNSGDHLKIGPLEFEVVIPCDDSTAAGSRLAGDTAKLSLEETDTGESPTGAGSNEPGDAENTQKPVQTDEAAADVLRRLRRFRRI